MDVEDVLETIGGLLEGLAFGFNVDNIVQCLSNLEGAGTGLVDSIKEFEKKDLAGVAAGLKDLGEALEDVSTAIPLCADAYKNDAEILEKELAVFKNPLTLVYTVGHNLVVNGNEIYDEVNTAITDFKAENWNGFGYNIGAALGKTLGEGKTIVELINSDPTSTWTATNYEQFEGMTLEELRCFTGLAGNPEKEALERGVESKPLRDDLPTSFDSRTKWPDCIHAIRN